MRSTGKIYILRNSSLKDLLVKVGRTSRNSEARAQELSKATGVPGPFEVLYEEDVSDMKLAESLVHQKLSIYRVNPKREFFLVPLKIAVRAVGDICRAVEQITAGQAQPRLMLYSDGQSSGIRLKDLLAPHRGGNTRVFVMFHHGHVAHIELGDQWDVHFSPDLLKDIKKLGHGIVWSWGLGSGDGKDTFEEILF